MDIERFGSISGHYVPPFYLYNLTLIKKFILYNYIYEKNVQNYSIIGVSLLLSLAPH